MSLPLLPPEMRLLAERRAETLRFPSDLPPAVSETWERVLAWSEFVAGVLRNCPELLESGWVRELDRPLQAGEIRMRVREAMEEAGDEAELMRRLRETRRAWSARIAWRDIAGWADVRETVSATSAVADALVGSALDKLHEWHRQRHGEARDADGRAVGLVVLGMGKLGGAELNFSSDIDLIFAYPESGESDGERPLTNEQYFTRLGQRLIRVLDEHTADGFVFRVDMRLRPFGDSGPLVMSFNGTESYYEQHGREWERYAFVKARPVAGDRVAGEALLARLRPFVYRRYLDFNVFESLREMKAAINREVSRREFDNHVKLGPGGIREAEFVLQLFQLVRGGREPALRVRGFHAALAAVVDSGSLSAQDGNALREAYDFLRRLENRLQQAEDAQVHEVPDDPAIREALAISLGFDGSEAFEREWRRHREAVRRLFDDTFLGPEPRSVDPVGEAWRAPREQTAVFETAGFRRPETVAAVLENLLLQVERNPPGAQGARRLEKLMPLLLEAAARQAEPELALARMLKLVEAVLGRTTYLSLLVESPRALEQLARVCAASDWIAQFVTRHPVLLDELIDPRLFEQAPTRESLEEELETQLARAPRGDLEAMLDALREYQQVSVMRIAAADISGVLPLMKVSDRLTDVAELVIQAALDPAEAHLVERHGEPQCRDGEGTRRAHFLVVGYGKFGGLELGYGSDLDLVFLHDSSGEEQQTDGPRALDNSLFFLRLTQRLIHFLSTPTAAGVLYEVDTRLRPSGQAGLLVSSLEAFEKYQREQAWTWEHQALLRARPVAGHAELAEAFRRLRMTLLCRPRDELALRNEVTAMRARMRGAAVIREGQFDLKSGVGGITDIEFLAQYWVLREAHRAPELLQFTDTIRFLEGLASSGLVPAERLDGLADAYRELRHSVHALALQGREPMLPDSLHVDARERVQAVWRAEFGDAAPPSA